MIFPFLNLVAYLFMVTLNALSITLPLGGMTTEQLSDKYNNPFTPIGFTFSIWSVIYTLLLIFVIAGLVNYFRGKPQKNRLTDKNIGYLFATSCLLNGGWILAWQYQYIALSVLVILAMLVNLILIHVAIRKNTNHINAVDRYITVPAFSIYLGWISVATMANIAAWTVSFDWSGWGLTQIDWTNILIVLATLLGTWMLIKFKDVWFNAVIIWSLYGIMTKRMAIDPVVFASIIMTTQVCMAFLVGAISTKVLLRK